jgi:hypothetical protein
MRTVALFFVAALAVGCGSRSDASVPLERAALPVAARFVSATYLRRSCREARALQRNVDPSLPCFDGMGSLPVSRSGRLSRPCVFTGAFMPASSDVKSGCAIFTVVSRKPNASMSSAGIPAYTYTSGKLALFMTVRSGRWFVTNPFYSGSGCAGTRRDCAPEELLWRRRARASASSADLLASSPHP